MKTGYVIEPAYQAETLAIINIILRKLTKEPIVWSEKKRVE
jgi:hypothetical protein